jgi:hypothetical protein
VFRVLRNGLILLFLLRPMICLGKSPDHIRSVAVSPIGKIIAVDFEKGGASFIYKIAVDTGNAIRLTDAKRERNRAQPSPQTESESHSLTRREM